MDDATRSAANTLRTWKARRETKGKPVTPEAVAARAMELWPDMTGDERAAAVAGVPE